VELYKENKDFIKDHIGDDTHRLAFQRSRYPNLDFRFCLDQIRVRQKSRDKLPSWHDNFDLIYPPSVSVEQASSEFAARYKASIKEHYKKAADLTGGFGIDSIAFAEQAGKLFYVEANKNLFEISTNNFKTLELDNIIAKNSTAEDFLKNTNEKFDLIYLDPDRRSQGKRLILLEDYSPNVVELQEKLFERTNCILLKVSPMMDISRIERSLRYIKEIHVFSHKNECKELIVLQEKGYSGGISYKAAIHQDEDTRVIEFYSEGPNMEYFSTDGKFLYEADAAIMKLAFWENIAREYSINKIAPNSHLYVSDELRVNFPGNVYKIEKKLSYDNKELKRESGGKANIKCRNFPDRPEEIKKRTGIKDGGDNFLFFTRDSESKLLVYKCKRIILF
jgi:16S rRNA G966 N2-methylase RsmD